MKNTSLKRSGILLPIAAVVLGLALSLVDPLPLRLARNHLFDQYQRWYPREVADVPVRIIDIDEESLARLGQWPWPRTRMAELVDRLTAARVAAIGFDMVFTEPDRTSPRAMAELWSLKEPLRGALEKLPDHDARLSRSLQEAPAILGFMVRRGPPGGRPDAGGAARPGPPPARPYRYIVSGLPLGGWLHAFDGAITSLPELEHHARGNGALSFIPDGDGVVRRVPLALRVAGEPVPTLVAETLRVAKGQTNYVLRTAGNDIGLAEIRIGQFGIPTTAEGEFWVHYSRARPNRYLPAWKILAGEIPGDWLDGHMVLIGSSAQGLMDLRFSPLGRIMPGVEVHAQALEQILTGHILQRPGWAQSVESLVIIIGSLVIGIAAIRAKALVAACLTLASLTVVMLGGWLAFRWHGLLLNAVAPVLTFTITFIAGSLLHHFVSEREQRWIREVFSRYVSPNRVTYLIDHPDAMELGGIRQTCSFIFTDLAGFTTLMETIDPAEAVALLNTYLDRMIAIAFRHEGTLDRIVGDAVAILFSAPIPQPDHPSRALACALEMDAFATAYAGELNARGIGFGRTRIGIHSGEVIVGNFGGSTIADYRALGDPVNTAARLESVNKHLGTRICLSEATLAGCPDAVVRPVGRLVLKGKSQALQVFEPILAGRMPGYASLDEYRLAYRRMADENLAPAAAEAFRDLARRYPEDPLVTFHLRRLEAGAQGDLIWMSEK